MIHALHGNFGQPSDWLAALPPTLPAHSWPLWEIRRHHPEARSLDGFARWFNHQVAALPANGPRLLAGYSLGGRLALHILKNQPQLWQGALLLSTHPGLASPAQRSARRTHDAAWSQRCLTLPWPDLLAAWNAQPVLHSSAPPPPPPPETWRPEIASAFLDWSLGAQADLIPDWPCLAPPIALLSGAADAKFTALAQSLVSDLPRATLLTLPHCGHRLLTEAPREIQKSLAARHASPP